MILPLLLAAAPVVKSPGDDAVAIFGVFIVCILGLIFGSILKVCVFPKKKLEGDDTP